MEINYMFGMLILGLALAVIGATYSISRVYSKGADNMARQPEVADQVKGAMIMPLALIESMVLMVFTICLMIVNK